MDGEDRQIRIIGVEKTAIKESPEHKGIWILPFKLSGKPDESWARNFYDVHKKNTSDMKRKANLADDCIMVSIVETDDLQKILDALKIDVLDTNALCEINFQKKLQIQQELDSLRRKHLEFTEKLKSDSDKLRF